MAPALLGLAFVGAGVRLKGLVEERCLSAELGPEADGAYRKGVPMLVPFGPTWR